jgi:hypothetical protein
MGAIKRRPSQLLVAASATTYALIHHLMKRLRIRMLRESAQNGHVQSCIATALQSERVTLIPGSLLFLPGNVS